MQGLGILVGSAKSVLSAREGMKQLTAAGGAQVIGTALETWGTLSMGRRRTSMTGPEKGALATSKPSSLLRSQSDEMKLQAVC